MPPAARWQARAAGVARATVEARAQPATQYAGDWRSRAHGLYEISRLVGERRKSRELALKVLYQMEHGDASAEEALASFADNFAAPARLWEYARELVMGISEYADQIDQDLAGASRRWRVERMDTGGPQHPAPGLL